MELRKVQLTGGSSITVTLPKAWIQKARISPGDVVSCSEQPDGTLAIRSHLQGERATQTYEFEAAGSGDALFRQVVAAYLMGYDSIRVTSRRPLTPSMRATVRSAVRRIMGLEIVDEQPMSITMQDFLDPREFQIEKALRRMSILTQSIQEEAAAAIRRPPATASPDDRDDEVDRLYWLVNKQFHAILRDSTYAAKMGLNASQALNYLLAARLVERTADHAERIVRQAHQLTRTRLPDALLERIEKQAHRAFAGFQSSLQIFFKRNAAQANELIGEMEKFHALQERLLRDAGELGGETVAHLAFVIESIGRTAAYASDIGEVAINHFVAGQAP
ncbi:MAG: phosphate uptake regulator PhoU [Euryarchaeota archaeon]|nr:phosphate uptake regulator PhoU [Euryarchaeota archaeon]